VDAKACIIAIVNVKKMRGRFTSKYALELNIYNCVKPKFRPLSFPRSLCQIQRNQISSVNDHDLDRPLPSTGRLSELALLKTFLSLHHHAFTDAALACIATEGGAKTFDFRGNVMFFSLRYRCHDDNPGTAFSFVSAECLPINKLYQDIPTIKEPLEALEDKYNSITEFNQATKTNFAGLLRMVYWADGNVVTKHLGITRDPGGVLKDYEGWLSELQFIIDNGLVAKEVDSNILQAGKIVKEGSHWKWVPLSSIS
jgi:hypothetical protein